MGLLIDLMIALGMLGVIGSLVLGTYAMARGGEFNQKWGNRFMRWRVTTQAISVVLILLGTWWYGSRH